MPTQRVWNQNPHPSSQKIPSSSSCTSLWQTPHGKISFPEAVFIIGSEPEKVSSVLKDIKISVTSVDAKELSPCDDNESSLDVDDNELSLDDDNESSLDEDDNDCDGVCVDTKLDAAKPMLLTFAANESCCDDDKMIEFPDAPSMDSLLMASTVFLLILRSNQFYFYFSCSQKENGLKYSLFSFNDETFIW